MNLAAVSRGKGSAAKAHRVGLLYRVACNPARKIKPRPNAGSREIFCGNQSYLIKLYGNSTGLSVSRATKAANRVSAGGGQPGRW